LAIPTGPDKRARKFLRANRVTIDYHLLEQNFEHFAAKCRYGEAFNLQVNDCCPAPFTFVLMWISAICDVCYSPRRPEIYILYRTFDEVRQNEDISDDSINLTSVVGFITVRILRCKMETLMNPCVSMDAELLDWRFLFILTCQFIKLTKLS
jgi:hypothetical protein